MVDKASEARWPGGVPEAALIKSTLAFHIRSLSRASTADGIECDEAAAAPVVFDGSLPGLEEVEGGGKSTKGGA